MTPLVRASLHSGEPDRPSFYVVRRLDGCGWSSLFYDRLADYRAGHVLHYNSGAYPTVEACLRSHRHWQITLLSPTCRRRTPPANAGGVGC